MVLGMVNTALCLIILVLGYLAYKRSGDNTPLLIGIAFGIFGISHIITLSVPEKTLTGLLIAIRVLAYLLVLFSLSRVIAKR